MAEEAELRYGERHAGPLRRPSIDSAELELSAVVKAESLYGARKSSNPAENLLFRTNGVIRAELERVGTLIGPCDMIPATAMANELTLVTRNTGEFSRLAGPRIEQDSVADT